jgi:cobalt-zinc-cadmium efflux system outer membrane protein
MNLNKMRYGFSIAMFLVLNFVQGNPQDTVISLQDAKARMVRSNLALLAAHYAVDISRAAIIQARLWSNPYFIFNGELYSAEKNEYFHFRNQHLLQLEQTFSIAGKHTNSVKLATLGAEMAERQLEDVLRSLIFETGNLYNDLAALQEKIGLYGQVLISYESLLESSKRQLAMGSISSTEAIRLQSEYLAIQTDALAIRNEKEQVMADLRTLLQMPEDTVFLVEQRLPVVVERLSLIDLVERATTQRPDLLLRKQDIKFQERNLKLQRSIAVPDLKMAYQPRDRGSNYVRPYQGFNVEFSLPLFNRNQGEIKSAQYQIAQSEILYDQSEIKVRNEVAAAFNRYVNSQKGLKNYDPDLLTRLKELNEGARLNFQNRNISLLQFIDYQRIFIQTNTQLTELKQEFLKNVNELNFVVGTGIIE